MRRASGLTAAAILLGGAVVLGGCAAAPPAVDNPLTIEDADFDAVFAAARDALAGRYFQEDLVDRRGGLIRTLPSTAGSAEEVWRRDSADAEGRLLATLHTIRKTATVQVQPAEPAGLTVAVTVTMQRRQLPTVEPTSTSESYSLFRREGTLLSEGADVESREAAWHRSGTAWWADLGRDEALESALLGEIRDRAAQASAP